MGHTQNKNALPCVPSCAESLEARMVASVAAIDADDMDDDNNESTDGGAIRVVLAVVVATGALAPERNAERTSSLVLGSNPKSLKLMSTIPLPALLRVYAGCVTLSECGLAGEDMKPLVVTVPWSLSDTVMRSKIDDKNDAASVGGGGRTDRVTTGTAIESEPPRVTTGAT